MEQSVKKEALASIEQKNESSVPTSILTKSEAIALTVQRKGSYKVSESESIQTLKNFSASVSDSKKSTIRTKSVTLKKSPKTGKDMYYEIVFEGDKGTGFSLLSADERAEAILCYSEAGSISDTLFNKSLKFCLALVDRYVEEQTKEDLDIEALASSAKRKMAVSKETMNAEMVQTKAIPPFDPEDPSPWYYVRTDIDTVVSERLKLVPGGWHQGSPFNDFLPYLPNSNERVAVGCAMIAVSQIMAYHKKPFRDYITTAMWPSMINNVNTSVELKNLMRDLFYDMVTSYDAIGTNSNINKARSFLNSNGYTAGSTTSYSYTNIWNALNYGPTYIRGSLMNGDGHAWVVDGARTTTLNYIDIYHYNNNGKIIEHTGLAFSYTTKIVRYDWGWGVSNENTWFNDNVFLMRTGYDFKYDISMISSVQ